MVKPKEQEGDEEKSDGLEIISIGSLYEGPWKKKYWSSSRGKDRYPYPVGYQALRGHNGSTCKMEILEGPKGPLFMITSDGHLCSGQTPDIAWENFQKNGCTRLKIWHGKRFSGKIDGIEFFGFKNPFVQRLLRELVANVNGVAGQNFLSSNFYNGASRMEQDNSQPNVCTYPDLLPYVATAQIKKKRTTKCEIVNGKSSGTSFKRARPQDMTCAEVPNSVEVNKKNNINVVPMPHFALEEENGFEPTGALPAVVYVKSVVEENTHISANDNPQLKSVDLFDRPKGRAAFTQMDCELLCNKNLNSTSVANDLSEELDRSQNTELKGTSYPVETEEKAIDSPVSKDSPVKSDINVCAPDTLDFEQDNTADFASSDCDKSAYSAADKVISDLPVAESHQEEINDIHFCAPNALDFEPDDTAKFASSDRDKSAYSAAGKVISDVPVTESHQEEIKDIHFCAPDTLDFVPQDDTTNFASSAYSVKWAFAAADKVISDGLVTESHQEEIGISSSNTSSENSDFDSVGQEMGKSMIRVLLPQAVPLLKEASRKKREAVSASKVLPHIVRFQQEDTKASQLEDVPFLALSRTEKNPTEKVEKMHTESLDPGSVVPNSEHTNGIVLDSCEDDQCGDHVTNRAILFSNTVDPDPGGFNKGVGTSDSNPRGIWSSVKTSRDDIGAETRATKSNTRTETKFKVYTRKKVSKEASSVKDYTIPPSESIKCSNSQDVLVSETCHGLHMEKTTTNFKAVLNVKALNVSQDQSAVFASKAGETSQSFNLAASVQAEHHTKCDGTLGQKDLLEYNSSVLSCDLQNGFCDNKTSEMKESQANSQIKPHRDLEINSELEGNVNLVGCYFHPMPISSLLLSTIENEIYICASCSPPLGKETTLFIYKVAMEEARIGCPSFLGQTLVALPFPKDYYGREIQLDRCVQFAPDGQYLILLDSIKTPYCREGVIDCVCSTCTSNCFEENALKIVQIKAGYVSIVAKLKIVESVQCLLVCENNYLIAGGLSGSLHLWTMNSSWSAKIEEFVIPASGSISSCILELKRIPNCPHLVVGCNGFGEFNVWDLSKRVITSKFSSPGNAFHQFIPIGLHGWCPVFSYTDLKGRIDEIMAVTKIWFSEQIKEHSYLPLQGEEFAVWLLVSTVSDSDALCDNISSHLETTPVKWWRLALLTKSMVILGTTLDLRAAAVGMTSGCGIMGTHDGLVYMWEICTGNKLGNLHHFKGGRVSCIATDDSRPGVLAVAGDDGQLLVYLHNPKNKAD